MSVYNVNYLCREVLRDHAFRAAMKVDPAKAIASYDLTAEERLVRFWEEHPHLKGRVPQRDVAAYLGITEEALSRIMSRRRKQRG